jgi:hypothetical protein
MSCRRELRNFLLFSLIALSTLAYAPAQTADYSSTIDSDLAANRKAYQFCIDQSVYLLSNAPRIEGSVIYGGQTHSLFATAFNWVEGDRDHRHKLFEKIFVEAQTRAAKLYALLGIYDEDRLEFEALANRMDPSEKVFVINGTNSSEVEVGAVLKSIRDKSLIVTIANPLEETNPDFIRSLGLRVVPATKNAELPTSISNSGTD